METLDRLQERLIEAQRNQRKALDNALAAVENALETILALKAAMATDETMAKFDKITQEFQKGLKA